MTVQPVPTWWDDPSQLDAGEKRVLTCQSCGHARESTALSARASGWRVYNGESVTGKDLSVVLCDACATGQIPVYVAACLTCGASSDEGAKPEDPPFTKADAEAWESEHDCEPVIEISRDTSATPHV